MQKERVRAHTIVAGLVKAGFVILATRGIEERGNRENQLDGVIFSAQRARRIINGIKYSKLNGGGSFGEKYFRTSELSEVLLLRTKM